MSDFELDDELLALAGVDKKRKRPQGSSKSSSSKKRKADMSDSEEDGPESEEGEEEELYPLEGKYVDEADRLRLLDLPEIEREEILAGRLEEKQRKHDKWMVSQMVNQQQHSREVDGVAKAAKRQHTARGATKEKSRKLDELKAKRKAKDEKQRTKGSPKRDRSSSPMDMDISDDESEDGQISKYEQEEEKERKMFSKPAAANDQPANLEDLERCRLSRDMLARHCMAPWFQDYVQSAFSLYPFDRFFNPLFQDAWVRYLIGQENGAPVYRICQITNLGVDNIKTYRLNDKQADQTLELKHGKSVKPFPMDKVSNSPFVLKEFDRLVRVCTAEDVKLPTKQALDRKIADMQRLVNQPVTESDINAMLARKNQLNAKKSTGLSSTMEKSRLMQARTLALRRQDADEVAEIDLKLAEMTAAQPLKEEAVDLLAKVNERNRKANMEAVRKAELAEAERKRRDRKLAVSGTQTPIDPSARLKIMPRLFDAATPTTRPGTPAAGATPPSKSASQPISPLPPLSVPALSLNGSIKSFEASIIDSIEIDLGDF
ncbi:hypothetical protein H0H87_002106 [Tephrocybe sp. NHM501043]|nr:hypothetical protein H0H87_002106 [Tephrocybe sp. NHM501043]